MENRQILEEMIRVARGCGEIILSAGEGAVDAEQKTSFRDLVTAYDRRVQEYAVTALAAAFPGAAFICEEGDAAPKADAGALTFVIDPIDGTMNFVHHFRHSCTSIACVSGGETVAGVVINPYSGELFSAARGEGASLNGRRLKIAPCALSETIVLFGTAPYNPELTDATFSRVRALFGQCQDVRRCGAAALDLCYVAAGRAGLYFEEIVSFWDYAAGALIVEEAGGACTRLDGAPLPCRGDQKTSIAAGVPALVKGLTAMKLP